MPPPAAKPPAAHIEWAKYLRAKVPGDAVHVDRRYDADEKNVVAVFTSANAEGTVAATIGVMEQNQARAGKPPLATEILLDRRGLAGKIANIAATIGFYIIKDGWHVAPGVTFAEMVSMYEPELRVKHVVFVPPFQWDEGMSRVVLGDRTIYPLLAVPIGRADLIRILAPVATLPDVEVLGAKLTVTAGATTPPRLRNLWEFRMKMYVVANDAQPVTLPTHAASARLEIPTGNVIQEFLHRGFHPQGQMDDLKGWRSLSKTVTFSMDEATVSGAGAVIFWAAYETSFDFIPGASQVTVQASIRAARTEVPMVFQNHLQAIHNSDRKACWVAGESVTDEGPFSLRSSNV